MKVAVHPPPSVKLPKLNGPAPVHVIAQGDLLEVVLHPAGSDPVILLDANVNAVPAVTLGALGEVVLATVAIRLVAEATSELPASGSLVAALVILEVPPDGLTKAQVGVGAVDAL